MILVLQMKLKLFEKVNNAFIFFSVIQRYLGFFFKKKDELNHQALRSALEEVGGKTQLV